MALGTSRGYASSQCPAARPGQRSSPSPQLMISQEQGQAKSKNEFPPVLPGPTTWGGGGRGAPERGTAPGSATRGRGRVWPLFFLKSKRSLSAASNTHFVRKKLPAVFFRYNM